MMIALLSGDEDGEFCASVLVVLLMGFEPFCSAWSVCCA
jgi:hypothetical protein